MSLNKNYMHMHMCMYMHVYSCNTKDSKPTCICVPLEITVLHYLLRYFATFTQSGLLQHG